MDKFEKQEKRIIAILGTKKLDVTRKTLTTYLKYLKNNVEIPCQLTGIEDFEWEEPYVFGFGSKREYEELEKTQPSYKDKFNLIKFVDDIDDQYDGIFVHVQRLSDKKKFVLPLADLKSMDKKSKNYRLLDDYSVWFVNNRQGENRKVLGLALKLDETKNVGLQPANAQSTGCCQGGSGDKGNGVGKRHPEAGTH